MQNLGSISEPKDLITKEYLERFVQDKMQGMGVFTLDAVYPVGSIYITTNSTNPGNLIGGTWVQWGAGKAVMGVNTSDADFNSAEKTGGAKNHTLSVAELPSHNHSFSGSSGSSGAHTHDVSGSAASAGSHKHGLKYTGSETAKGTGHGWINNDGGSTLSDSVKSAGAHTHTVSGTAASAGAHTHTVSGTVGDTGSGSAFSTLPPYITCYMWKRTA